MTANTAATVTMNQSDEVLKGIFNKYYKTIQLNDNVKVDGIHSSLNRLVTLSNKSYVEIYNQFEQALGQAIGIPLKELKKRNHTRNLSKILLNNRSYIPLAEQVLHNIEKANGIYKAAIRLMEQQKDINSRYLIEKLDKIALNEWFNKKFEELANICQVPSGRGQTIIYNAFLGFLNQRKATRLNSIEFMDNKSRTETHEVVRNNYLFLKNEAVVREQIIDSLFGNFENDFDVIFDDYKLKDILIGSAITCTIGSL